MRAVNRYERAMLSPSSAKGLSQIPSTAAAMVSLSVISRSNNASLKARSIVWLLSAS
jgi:hypothetical protein